MISLFDSKSSNFDPETFYKGAQVLAMAGLSRIEDRYPCVKQYTADQDAQSRWRLSIITAWVVCATLSLFEHLHEDKADSIKDEILEQFKGDYGDLTPVKFGLDYIGQLIRDGVKDQWAYGFFVFTQLTGIDADDSDMDLVESLGTVVIEFADQWWKK